MSYGDEAKRAAQLELEIDALLAGTQADAEKTDPDKIVISSGIFPAQIARALGIDSDKVFFATVKRLLRAGVVPGGGLPGHPRTAISRIFDVARFLDEHREHLLIRRLVGLPPTMAPEEEGKLREELRETFPPESLRQEAVTVTEGSEKT